MSVYSLMNHFYRPSTCNCPGKKCKKWFATQLKIDKKKMCTTNVRMDCTHIILPDIILK